MGKILNIFLRKYIDNESLNNYFEVSKGVILFNRSRIVKALDLLMLKDVLNQKIMSATIHRQASNGMVF